MATTAPAPAPAMPVSPRPARRSGTAQDRRTEVVLALVAATVLALCAGMLVFVLVKAWPSFEANGLAWFGNGDVDQQLGDIFKSPADPKDYVYTLGALPLIVGTFLTTAAAVVLGLLFSIFTAVFIVEFAPAWLNRILEPVVRLLAAVPSVVYGLIGILVLVPFMADHLISTERKESVAFIVQLTGASWTVAAVILTVMILPIMIAIIVDALRAVPSSWTEGAAALGVNRWRVMWTISIRTARPAIIAAVILATARALGEAIMLAMVAGSVGFIPNPFDGLTFLFEPVRPLAAAVVENAEGLSVVPFGQTIYAFAFILLISSMILSLGGWLAKRSMRRYGIQS